MQQVKNKDSDIELKLRKKLCLRGIRYRKKNKEIVGITDIVFVTKKVVAFYDSEFWLFVFSNNTLAGQKYQQFGKSVSMPVIERMADFIYDRIQQINQNYEAVLCNYVRKNSDISDLLRLNIIG